VESVLLYQAVEALIADGLLVKNDGLVKILIEGLIDIFFNIRL
jgi:hypothetical protein